MKKTEGRQQGCNNIFRTNNQLKTIMDYGNLPEKIIGYNKNQIN